MKSKRWSPLNQLLNVHVVFHRSAKNRIVIALAQPWGERTMEQCLQPPNHLVKALQCYIRWSVEPYAAIDVAINKRITCLLGLIRLDGRFLGCGVSAAESPKVGCYNLSSCHIITICHIAKCPLRIAVAMCEIRLEHAISRLNGNELRLRSTI